MITQDQPTDQQSYLNIILRLLNHTQINYEYYIVKNDAELIYHFMEIDTPIKTISSNGDEYNQYDIKEIINNETFKTHNDEWIKVRLSGKNLHTWQSNDPIKINKMMNDILNLPKRQFNLVLDKRRYDPFYGSIYSNNPYNETFNKLLRAGKIKSILEKR